MTPVSILVAAALYAGAASLVIGLVAKIVTYARTPQRFAIPTTPAPVTRGGVVLRMAREVVLFESLFKASRWTWAFGWVFHAALLAILLGHARYFTEPLWTWLPQTRWIAPWLGGAMIAGLCGLWARRLLVDRVRYISAPSDHLMLALLLGIGLSGMTLDGLSAMEREQLRQFAAGLVGFGFEPMPERWNVAAHLLGVAVLLGCFAFSKLLHAPGVFFSPTRNQADDVRERRTRDAVEARSRL